MNRSKRGFIFKAFIFLQHVFLTFYVVFSWKNTKTPETSIVDLFIYIYIYIYSIYIYIYIYIYNIYAFIIRNYSLGFCIHSTQIMVQCILINSLYYAYGGRHIYIYNIYIACIPVNNIHRNITYFPASLD